MGVHPLSCFVLRGCVVTRSRSRGQRRCRTRSLDNNNDVDDGGIQFSGTGVAGSQVAGAKSLPPSSSSSGARTSVLVHSATRSVPAP